MCVYVDLSLALEEREGGVVRVCFVNGGPG